MRTGIFIFGIVFLVGLAGCRKAEKTAGDAPPVKVAEEPRSTYTVTPAPTARQPEVVQEPVSTPAESYVPETSAQPSDVTVPPSTPTAEQPSPSVPTNTAPPVVTTPQRTSIRMGDPMKEFLGEADFPDFAKSNAAMQLRNEYYCPSSDKNMRLRWRNMVDDVLAITMDDGMERLRAIQRVDTNIDMRTAQFLPVIEKHYRQWKANRERMQKKFPGATIND
ncbi:MAG: hypothetical protein ACYC6A_20800 [Armatimonadota bacterium]